MDSVSDFIIIFWIISIVVYFISSLYFLIERQNSGEDDVRKRIMTLVFLIVFFIALSRLFHLIVIFRHGGYFMADLSLENEIIFTTSQIFLYIGVTTIIFSFERKLKKFEKCYFTILLLILAAIYFIFRHIYIFNKNNDTLIFLDFITGYVMNAGYGIFGLILAFMYLRISLKTSGDVKKKSLFVFLGFILILASYSIFFLEDFLVDPELIALISFSLGIIGIPFLILGYK